MENELVQSKEILCLTTPIMLPDLTLLCHSNWCQLKINQYSLYITVY